jgi:hypothetical protein
MSSKTYGRKRNLTDEELDVFFRTNYPFQLYPKGILAWRAGCRCADCLRCNALRCNAVRAGWLHSRGAGGAMLLTEGFLGWDGWRDGCKGGV